MTTPRKTTRKAAPKTTGAEVVVKSEEKLLEEEAKTAIQAEVETEDQDEEEDYPTYIVKINGEDIEINDVFPQGKIPAALMFLTPKSSEVQLAHYGGLALQQLLGEEQLMKLFELGASTADLQSVVPAWRESRGLGK